MTTASSAAQLTEKPRGFRLKMITMALILAPLLQVLDTSIISIALKQMQGSLSATQDQIAWALTSYLIALAVVTPFWGAVSGRYGRKPLLLVSICGFVVCSAFCGTSETLTELLVYRVLQGILGAALIPLSQSALLSIYPREDYGIAMSWWGVGIMFGPIFGPTLGGYITEFYSWRWAFYLNLPIGVVAFLMIAAVVPRPGNRTQRPFNFFGYAMLAIAIASLQFILDRGQRFDWFASTTIVILSGITVAALWVFVVNSAVSRTPFVDPLLFRDRNYMSGIVLRILFGIMLFGSLVLLPPFIQNQGGYSLLDSGLIMAPRGAGAMFAAFFTGYLLKAVGPRVIITFGMVTTAVTMWEMSEFTHDVDMWRIIVINFIQGVAFSCFIIPVSTVAFSTIGDEQRDVGTAFYQLLNNIGRSLGIALLANYLASNTQAHHARLVEFVTPYNQAFHHLPLPDIWNLSEPAGLAMLEKIINHEAELLAYIGDFRLLAVIIVICIPVVFLMRDPLRKETLAGV